MTENVKDKIRDNRAPLRKDAKDLTGMRFGKLVVIRFLERRGKKWKKPYWLCRCDCGKEHAVQKSNLLRGNVESCGCAHWDCHITHGHSRNYEHHWLYMRWSSMITRCTNPKRNQWKNYGGRGIYVCDRWRDFELFRKDMEPSYFDGAELERKDNDGPYSPENTVWATPYQNSQNKRNTLWVRIQEQWKTASEWAKELGMGYFRFYNKYVRDNNGQNISHGNPN